MKKNIFIAVIVLSLAIIGFFAIQFLSSDRQEGFTNDDFIQVITEDSPAFAPGGKPAINVESVSRHDEKWYVVTIKSLRPVEQFVPVKVALLDTGSGLQVITGPETHFSEPEMLALNLPDSVILELGK